MFSGRFLQIVTNPLERNADDLVNLRVNYIFEYSRYGYMIRASATDAMKTRKHRVRQHSDKSIYH